MGKLGLQGINIKKVDGWRIMKGNVILVRCEKNVDNKSVLSKNVCK